MKPWLITLGCLLIAGCSAQDRPPQSQPAEKALEEPAMLTVTSRDGTRIAYDRLGAGPAVILINGALADRSASAEIARLLASHFTVLTYDRRGKGDSGDTPPYAVAREVEDIAALIAAAGGTAHVVGFSSGAALALEAAGALGPKVPKLALYEAPYDEAPGAAAKWKAYRAEQAKLLAAGRAGEAVLHHMKFAGVPDPVVAQLRGSPAWAGMEAMAATLPYDVAVIGDDRSVPTARAAKVSAVTLVMDGGANRDTMPFMAASANKIAEAIPDARRRTLEGEGHNVSAKAVAPLLISFLEAT